MWSALKLYARVRDADKDFRKFKNELTPGHVETMRDYRLKWILQLVVAGGVFFFLVDLGPVHLPF